MLYTLGQPYRTNQGCPAGDTWDRRWYISINGFLSPFLFLHTHELGVSLHTPKDGVLDLSEEEPLPPSLVRCHPQDLQRVPELL